MSSATQPVFVKDAWQSPRNARTLRAFMALQNQEIGRRIAELRKAKGSPPQTLVAAALGVGERTYQTWESGEAKPSYRSLQLLAAYYGVGEDYILTGSAPASEPEGANQVDRLARIESELAAMRAERDDREQRIQGLLETQEQLLKNIQSAQEDILKLVTAPVEEIVERVLRDVRAAGQPETPVPPADAEGEPAKSGRRQGARK